MIGGYIGHVPTLVTIFEFTIRFCIEPGAGISGIGNGFIDAPAQYAFTPLPNSFTNENLSDGDDIPFSNATKNSVSIICLLPTCIDSKFMKSIPRFTAASYSSAQTLATVLTVLELITPVFLITFSLNRPQDIYDVLFKLLNIVLSDDFTFVKDATLSGGADNPDGVI